MFRFRINKMCHIYSISVSVGRLNEFLNSECLHFVIKCVRSKIASVQAVTWSTGNNSRLASSARSSRNNQPCWHFYISPPFASEATGHGVERWTTALTRCDSFYNIWWRTCLREPICDQLQIWVISQKIFTLMEELWSLATKPKQV